MVLLQAPSYIKGVIMPKKGYKQSKEHIEKRTKRLANSAQFQVGIIPWNKGKKGEYSVKHSGQFPKGTVPWNKLPSTFVSCIECGKEVKVYPCNVEKTKFCSRECKNKNQTGRKLTKKQVENITSSLIGNQHRLDIPHTKESKEKISQSNKGRESWNKGVPHTKETKKKISKSLEGKMRGPNNPMWKGGISAKGYTDDWDETKRFIYELDGYRCQQRGCGQVCSSTPGKRLIQCHHIDRDKKNNQPMNLVTCCRSDHSKIHGGTVEFEWDENTMTYERKILSRL